jgi:mono/diheme cytochrome c family protein
MKSNRHHPSLLALLGLLPLASAFAADPAPKATPAQIEAGKQVYARVCFACHQPTGLGLPGAFPPLAGSSIVTEADPKKIIRIVLHGLQGPIEVKGVKYNSVMPPHGPQLKDQEIADVLTYVRNTWENKAAPVSADVVAQIRKADKARTTMWTWAELTK